jgi:lysozyme family protein
MEFETGSGTIAGSGTPNRKSSSYIKWVQQSLNSILGLKLSEDGMMGTNTRSAIRSFQQKAGFTGKDVDGIVGAGTEAALIKAGAGSPPGTHIAASPVVSQCVGQTDITQAFRRFLNDVPALVQASSQIAKADKPGIIAMVQAVIAIENSVDITGFTVLTCTQIINPLLAGLKGGARAEIDVASNTLKLKTDVWQNEADFRSSGDPYFLTDFFQVIAHEKRHATLGSTVVVSTASLRPGSFTSDAWQAQYRVEEILANAEELAIGKRLLSGFTVSVVMQQKIRNHWVMIDARVTTAELARLRALIIQQLRNRYGFTGTCDNPITVGVLMSMENGSWYSCFNGGTLIPGPIPAGLMLCKRPNGSYTICP